MSAPLHEALPESASDSAQAEEAGESRHRYPPRAVMLDYLYAGLGLLFTVGPMAATAPSGPAAWVLSALAALFAAYGVRTVLRHRTWLSVSEDGITVHGFPRRRLAWDQMTRCTLGYYSTRRNRDRGWMQLTLKAGRRSLRIESQIEGFERIVGRAARAAAAHGLALDNTTRENLRALEIAPGAEDRT